MNARIAESQDPGGAAAFGTGFFDVGLAPALLVLLGFATALPRAAGLRAQRAASVRSANSSAR